MQQQSPIAEKRPHRRASPPAYAVVVIHSMQAGGRLVASHSCVPLDAGLLLAKCPLRPALRHDDAALEPSDGRVGPAAVPPPAAAVQGGGERTPYPPPLSTWLVCCSFRRKIASRPGTTLQLLFCGRYSNTHTEANTPPPPSARWHSTSQSRLCEDVVACRRLAQRAHHRTFCGGSCGYGGGSCHSRGVHTELALTIRDRPRKLRQPRWAAGARHERTTCVM
eukprot:COSAG01_NODE_3558_length_5936_cov_199.186911_4_plen_222_part_00